MLRCVGGSSGVCVGGDVLVFGRVGVLAFGRVGVLAFGRVDVFGHVAVDVFGHVAVAVNAHVPVNDHELGEGVGGWATPRRGARSAVEAAVVVALQGDAGRAVGGDAVRDHVGKAQLEDVDRSTAEQGITLIDHVEQAAHNERHTKGQLDHGRRACDGKHRHRDAV